MKLSRIFVGLFLVLMVTSIAWGQLSDEEQALLEGEEYSGKDYQKELVRKGEVEPPYGLNQISDSKRRGLNTSSTHKSSASKGGILKQDRIETESGQGAWGGPNPKSKRWRGLMVVNNSRKTMFFALGQYKYDDGKYRWVSNGWYSIAPGKAKHILKKVKYRYYYYYAEAGKYVWEGNVGFWVHDWKPFDDVDRKKNYRWAKKRKLVRRWFRKIDTEDYRRYVLYLGKGY